MVFTIPFALATGFDTIPTCFSSYGLLHQAINRGSYFTTSSLKAFLVALVKPVASLIYSVIKEG